MSCRFHVFANSFTRNFPLNNFDPGPRNGTFPTDPFLTGGPFITDAMRAALAAQFPPGQTVRNTGATWDNPDRVMPYTDRTDDLADAQTQSPPGTSANWQVISRSAPTKSTRSRATCSCRRS